MSPTEILQQLQSQFGERITGSTLDVLDPWIEVEAAAILDVARYLKHDPALRFDSLNNLCAVDWFDADAKKQAKLGDARLEVVYHLFSFTHKHRLVIKCRLPRHKAGAAGELPEIPSVSSIWAIADWHERETYDLMGIRFQGHPNLRRILCPEDWVGHPLRKDYEFPLEYHGIRGR